MDVSPVSYIFYLPHKETASINMTSSTNVYGAYDAYPRPPPPTPLEPSFATSTNGVIEGTILTLKTLEIFGNGELLLSALRDAISGGFLLAFSSVYPIFDLKIIHRARPEMVQVQWRFDPREYKSRDHWNCPFGRLSGATSRTNPERLSCQRQRYPSQPSISIS